MSRSFGGSGAVRYLAFLLFALPPLRTSAQAPNIPKAPNHNGCVREFRDPLQAALTVEGGGTLGAYEAGLSWALVELFRLRRDTAMLMLNAEQMELVRCLPLAYFRAAAGASAGSINAFLASQRWCSTDPPSVPERSEFWTVWIPTGLTQLLPGWGPVPNRNEKGLLARSYFDSLFLKLDARWRNTHYDAHCNVLFGATITHLARDSVEISEQVHPRNQRFAARFVVQGAPAFGLTPRFLAPRKPDTTGFRLGGMIELPEWGDSIAHASAYDLIKASSGFPLAFEPYRIEFCDRPSFLYPTPSDSLPCGIRQTTRGFFVDGGVFDNGPLALGYGLALEHSANVPLSALTMLFITPDRRRTSGKRWDRYGDTPPGFNGAPEERDEGLDAVAKLLQQFVPSARQYELQIAARLLPTVQESQTEGQKLHTQLDRVRNALRDQSQDASATFRRLSSEWVRYHDLSDRLKHQRDSLAYVLAECRSSASIPCDSVPADTAVLARGLPVFRADSTMPPALPPPVVIPPDTSSDVPSFDKQLYVTARWHPLAGDWLAGFGGFLGQPLREYDFLVGIYDAYALVAQRLLCAKPQDSTCGRTKLREMIEHSPLPLLRTARVSLARLYNEEFGPTETIRGVGDTLRSQRDFVIAAVISAMAARMGTEKLGWRVCKDGGPIERFECSTGVDSVFRTLGATPRFTEMLETDAECPDSLKSSDDCIRDPNFARFVKDPFAQLNSLAGEMLGRMDETTPKKSALKPPLILMSATYFATNERARVGWDGGSVSLPTVMSRRSRLVFSLFPSNVGGFAGIPGWYLEWTTRLHFNRSIAIGPTARVIWGSGFWRPNSSVARGKQFVPGLRAEYKFPGGIGPWITTAGLQIDYWTDWYLMQLYPQGFESRGVSPAITTALLAQRLRITLGMRPEKYVIRKKETPRLYMSFGLGDLNGTLYWIKKALFK